jgi:hypothetical protein
VHFAFFSLAHLTDDMLFFKLYLNKDQVTCLILVHIFYGVIALIFLLCNVCPVQHYKLSDDLLKCIELISQSLSSPWFLSFFSCEHPNHPFYHTCVHIVQCSKIKQMMTI